MSFAHDFTPETFSDTAPDRIAVFGGGAATLDLLRLATIRSDDVVLVGAAINETALAYARRFAIEHIAREAEPSDVPSATVMLVALGDIERENSLVRAARRAAVPVHVSGRSLVSDFTLLEFLERRSATARDTA